MSIWNQSNLLLKYDISERERQWNYIRSFDKMRKMNKYGTLNQ
jgi:hypothetical protein